MKGNPPAPSDKLSNEVRGLVRSPFREFPFMDYPFGKVVLPDRQSLSSAHFSTFMPFHKRPMIDIL